MPRVGTILFVAVVLLTGRAEATETASYQAVFKVCGIPEKAKNVDGLIKAGWRPIDRSMAIDSMGRYLALANATNLEELKNLQDWGLNLAKGFSFQDGDILFMREKSQDFLWLRYTGEMLEACTLVGSTKTRTDILLKEIWSCSDWFPVAETPNEIERWVCSKPTMYFTGFPDKKLTPSIALIPEQSGLEPQTLVFQVRT